MIFKGGPDPSDFLLPVHPASFVHNVFSGMQSFYFSKDAMVIWSWDSLIDLWETASPRTHKPKIGNESLGPPIPLLDPHVYF